MSLPDGLELAYAVAPMLQHLTDEGADLRVWVRENIVTVSGGQAVLGATQATVTAVSEATLAYNSPADQSAPALRLRAAHALRQATFYAMLLRQGSQDPRLPWATTDQCMLMRRWRLDCVDTVSLLVAAASDLSAALSTNPRGVPASPDGAAMASVIAGVYSRVAGQA
jgi:hypothetical protein